MEADYLNNVSLNFGKALRKVINERLGVREIIQQIDQQWRWYDWSTKEAKYDDRKYLFFFFLQL